MNSTVLAEFENVSKRYPGGPFHGRAVQAVDNISLSIKAGEVFALIGPNRAGKTTLIKILLSLCNPTQGSVRRLGRPIRDRSTLGRVGYVHENHAFPRYLTASGLLGFYGALTLVSRGELNHRIPALLERVGLADRANEPISRFSKGMAQRLALAQALLNEPDLLVLDEPTEGLDMTGRQMLREVIVDLRKHGKTVILVTHMLAEVEALADRVAVISQGKVAFEGALSGMTNKRATGKAQTLEQALQPYYVN